MNNHRGHGIVGVVPLNDIYAEILYLNAFAEEGTDGKTRYLLISPFDNPDEVRYLNLNDYTVLYWKKKE